MKTIKVYDMQCEMCVKRISKALEVSKVDCEINLENKTVTVENDKVMLALAEIDDLGFTAKAEN